MSDSRMPFADLRAEFVRRMKLLDDGASGGFEALLSLLEGDETSGLGAVATDSEGLGFLRSTLALLWHSAYGSLEGAEGTDRCVRAFRHVGFVTDDEACTAPTEPLVVYRGATPANARRMAWTTERDMAEGHARAEENDRLLEPGRVVWRAVAPPDAVLAIIVSRDEDEVVVDPAMLLDLTAEAEL